MLNIGHTYLKQAEYKASSQERSMLWEKAALVFKQATEKDPDNEEYTFFKCIFLILSLGLGGR
jgi:hypothetical protein